MWIGQGPYDSWGWQSKPNFVKGSAEYILPNTVYQVQDRDPPRSETQYWIVPIDQAGKQIGEPTLKIFGQRMYSIWEGWKNSEAVFMYNYWPGPDA
jgi:hypothetical protein